MTGTCAVHSGAPARFTCERCGSFACEACASPEDAICASCDRLRGAVLGADVSAGGLIGDSFRLVARFGATIVALAVVDTVASTAINAAGGVLPQSFVILVLLMLTGIAVTTVVEASWISLLAAAAAGRAIGLKEALTRGLSVAVPLFGCNLLLGLGVGVGLMLLVVPGLILALGWSLAAPSVVVARQGPVEGLTESWSLTQGQRGTLFLALLGTAMVAFVVALATGAAAGMLERLVPAAAPLFRAGNSLLTTIAAAPVITVPVLAYLRLSRRASAD